MSEQLYTHESYKKWFPRIRPIARILYPHTAYGLENIPDAPCLVCANHSSFVDPVLVALSFGEERPIHFMAKIELFRRKWMANLLGQVGAFGVDRDGADISAIRTVMKYIRAGEKVGIFPEGTRVAKAGMVEAKSGAARMAAKLRVPILPVYISRKKGMFRRAKVIVGAPIYVPADTQDFQLVTNELMETIERLGSAEV